ncbi:putative F-box/WD repeat-containing protein 7 [Apostichopus japonicus]|uniref:Putative F-box/WD repeat-containing protein 7 n=1 Tax=Stichopus japonicus TaxID=307972 RepID=A0A2G8KQY1_STIJA|nr:putative F-box/WD repeat-containing protein 7 [Apostichopus japonicus]
MQDMDRPKTPTSEIHKAARSPSKRSKTKSKVWNKVVRMTHKSKSSGNNVQTVMNGVATGEIGGAACLPHDNMDVEDIPSSNDSSTSTSRQFSDWSSSSESLYHNGSPTENSRFVCKTCNTGAVVFQPCVKPSLVRSVLGPCMNSSDNHKKNRKGKGRTVKRKSQYSCEEDGSSLEETCGGIQVESGSNSEECHCPSCCSCQSNFRSQIYKSWPRKYDCPLKTFVIGRVNRSFDRRGFCSSDENCYSSVMSKQAVVRVVPNSSKVWNGCTGHCRIISKVTQSCCCARQIEYERKSRSLPNRANLNRSSMKCSPTDYMNQSSECNQTLHLKLPCFQDRRKNQLLGVDGAVYKERMELVMSWFHEFSDQQKNSMMKTLLEQCDLPQMHMLSVTMEPILHKHCPHNCQDLLSWLPKRLSHLILSYLDPVSLCRCSLVSRSWYEMANEPALWKTFCLHPRWRLSKGEEQKQIINHMSSYVYWKQVFAERFRLCRNWLGGLCTVRTFEGHTQGISCVQFDDTRIVSGSSDKTIKVWNIRTNSPWSVQTLTGHSGTVRCLHLEGNMLVSGSTDRTIKVWDLSTQSSWSSIACRVTMIGHMDTVRCLQVDDDKVVSGSYDRTLKVWDIKTGNCRFTLRGHHGAVLCLQFDNVKIISGSADNTIKIWSLGEEVCLTTLSGHQDAVTCLQFDANKIISGSLDRNLKYWDIQTGRCTSTIDWAHAEGHTGVVRCLQADSWRVVSASDDRTIKVWNFETGERLVTLQHHSDGVTCLQFNSSKIVSGSYDKTVKLWDFGSV